MDEITIRYWSPHGRQEETKYKSNDKNIDLTMRAAKQVDLLDLSKCTSLMILNLSNNLLEDLDLSPLSGNQSLTEVNLENNHLAFIDLWPLGNCPFLGRLKLTHNRLQKLDITPVLAKVQALIDSSVVISADSVLRYLLTSHELAERFLLVRPDRAPWAAAPVLMWVTYDDLAKKYDWCVIRERILTVLKQTTENDWYQIQRGLLIGLGMEELAGFDGNPVNLLDTTDNTMDFEEARREIFDCTVELLDHQIENEGPTLFLDIERMRDTRASKLIGKIVDARRREIEDTVVPMKGSIALMNNLWLTHYGYRILEALDVGLRQFGAGIEKVRASLEDLGLPLKTFEVESIENDIIEPAVVVSRSMKRFIHSQIEKAYL